MDPRITESMMEKGELPNFSRLHYSRLPTINPSQSPVVWTTIATGVPPSDHGIFDFIQRDPKNYLPYLSMLQLKGFRYLRPVRAKTFWEKASEKEIPSTIIRWPVTFPPAPFKGRILSGLGVPDIRRASMGSAHETELFCTLSLCGHPRTVKRASGGVRALPDRRPDRDNRKRTGRSGVGHCIKERKMNGSHRSFN